MSSSSHTPGDRLSEGGAQTGRQARAAHEAPAADLAPAGLQATAATSRMAGVAKQVWWPPEVLSHPSPITDRLCGLQPAPPPP